MHSPTQSEADAAEPTQDVVVVGGALAGAATALLLRRWEPRLRVLIVEKSTALGRRVGEATVEVSAYFLTRVLGLTQYLNESHLVKQGFRFWFAHEQTQTLADCAEVGGRYLARVAAFQVDRATLDEELLRRAVAAGATLWRPATVQRIELRDGGQQIVTVRMGEKTEQIRARWVVDASGVAALLAREHGWFQTNTAHPTAAVWARWRGVKDLDGLELATRYPEWSAASYGIRQTATNHFMGPGWWAWMIPLKGGDVSVGVVYDQRYVDWPREGAPADRLKAFLSRHPAARELLQDASCLERDVHSRRDLAWFSTRLAGNGFVLVGDAAGFIDPLYSPGMDWVSFTTYSAARLILQIYQGQPAEPLIQAHNHCFTRSLRRWFEAVYLNKYEYLGEMDLMLLAFQLDLGLYYLGVASQPYKRGHVSYGEPIFTTPPSVPVYHLIRFYNRRLAAMGRARRERGLLGKRNGSRRCLLDGYTFEPRSLKPVLGALIRWGWLEVTEGWRSWGRPQPAPILKPVAGGQPSAVGG